MKWAALIAWVLTAGGGFALLTLWLRRGGMRQAREEGTRIRPPLLFSHFLLAASGLVLWVVYLVSDSDALAWISFVLLLVVALLGFGMFAIWLQRRQARAAGAPAPEPAEQHFPVPIVALHGVLGATTLVLVLLAALEVGG
jgi:uncharacterized membrane protein SirB2